MRSSSSGARGARIGLGVIASLVLAAGTARAAAAPPELVILLEPADASPATIQSLRRIKEEVAADRFEVVIATPGTATDAVSPTWRAERGAWVVLFGDPKSGRVELCVVSRANQHTAVRRAIVADSAEKMPDVLASRALELLRATALELSVEAVKTTPPREQAQPIPNGKPQPATTAARAEESFPFSVDTGIVVMQALKGLEPSLAPILRLGYRVASWVELRTSAAGLGTRPSVETRYGSASVSQSFLLLELVTRLSDRGALRPIASLGGGLLHVGISGAGVPPYVGRHPERWSASIDGGVGLALPFRSRAGIVAELHCLLALPHPSIRFVDSVPATIGYPALMLTLALELTP